MRVVMVTHRQFHIQALDNSTVTIMPVRHGNLGHWKEMSFPSLSCDDSSGCLLERFLALLERGKSFRAEERMNEDSISLPRCRDGALLLVLDKTDKELFSFITKFILSPKKKSCPVLNNKILNSDDPCYHETVSCMLTTASIHHTHMGENIIQNIIKG
jgi:hypothetical protein